MSNQTSHPLHGLTTNKSKMFNYADHANDISKKLQSFYEKKEFFDIVIVAGVDNVRLQAHRLVLSASSDFFLTMCRSPLQEDTADEIELKDIDGITMRQIIDFMYTAEIELHCENIESVLSAADFLQINSLIDACCNFMQEQIDASNCLGIGLFAEQHNCCELHREAFSFALEHFDEVCTEKEFLQLNEEQLIKYISSDDLFTRSEENVLRSVVTWFEYDKKNREKSISNLLSHVRFVVLDRKFISDNEHLLPVGLSQFATENPKRRRAKRTLVIVSGESTNELKVYTLKRESVAWSDEKVPTPSKNRTEYAAVIVKRKLIIAGGEIDGVLTNSVECLDLQTKQWTNLPPMKIPRKNSSMAELNGDFYVVGGYTGYDTHWSRCVEKYDFYTREWQDVAQLNSKFGWIRVAAAEEGFLYAAGLDSIAIECYDAAADKWRMTANKNEELSDCGIVAAGGYLYAIGGYNGGYVKKPTIERYQHSTNTWSFVNSILPGQNSVKCAALDNRPIATGGFDGFGYSDSVEEYNPETDEWESLAPLPELVKYFKIFSM